jgi:hypothetical protein
MKKRKGTWTSIWTLTALVACIAGVLYGSRHALAQRSSCCTDSHTAYSSNSNESRRLKYSGLYAGGLDQDPKFRDFAGFVSKPRSSQP